MKKEHGVITGLKEALEYSKGNKGNCVTHTFCDYCKKEIEGDAYPSMLIPNGVLCLSCNEEEGFEAVWGISINKFFGVKK